MLGNMCTNYSSVTNQVAFLQTAYSLGTFAARGTSKNQASDRMRRWSSDSTLASSFTEPPQCCLPRKNKVLPVNSSSTSRQEEELEERFDDQNIEEGLYVMPQQIISEPAIKDTNMEPPPPAKTAQSIAVVRDVPAKCSRLRRYENGSQILDLLINKKPSRGLGSSSPSNAAMTPRGPRHRSKLEAIAWLGGSNIVVFRSFKEMKNSQTRYILGERLPTSAATPTPRSTASTVKPLERFRRQKSSSSLSETAPKVKETFLFVGSSHAFRVMMQERLNQLEQEAKSAEEAKQQHHPRRNSIHESFATSIPHPKVPTPIQKMAETVKGKAGVLYECGLRGVHRALRPFNANKHDDL